MNKLVVGLLIAFGAVALAQNDACNPSNSFTWSDVPQASWSTDPATVGDSTKTPVGFRTAVLYEDNNPPICLTVPTVRGRAVEIMVESQNPGARICIRDPNPRINMAQGEVVGQCGFGRVNSCFTSSTNIDDLKVIIYCDQACRTANTNIWYRVRKSAMSYADNLASSDPQYPEMWCDMIKSDPLTMFPTDLRPQAPDAYVYQPADYSNGGMPKNSGAYSSRSVVAVLASVFVAVAISLFALPF
eukprot:TRINITY_DN14336_c0_g2_i2.p1 TRINITY_DN14336_c0_g2~~TRINITY_DN14336_c0_g2_i2.p1  ORF type:complete len:244 (-),score=88.38 TRINITY_DN14336_c0_g2_i2:183-914(-)